MNRFDLKPSRQLLGVLVMAHSLALVMVFLAALPPGVKAAAAALVLVSAYYYVRREALRAAPDAIVALHLGAARACTLETVGGACWEGNVLNTSFVSAKLAIVNVRLAAKRKVRHVVVLSDTLAAEDFRRLRVLLRWRCGWRGKHVAAARGKSRR
ncbi:MAG TPA: hypothetical protein DEP05_00870 [Betaproteobacteria bacterium]|nr:hypothetical protein [Betaproteobacteria bacterium]